MTLLALLISLTLMMIHQSMIVMSVRGPQCSKIVRLDLGIVNNISHKLDYGLLTEVRESLRMGIEEAFDVNMDDTLVSFGACWYYHYARPFLPSLDELDHMMAYVVDDAYCSSTKILNYLYQNDERKNVEDAYLIISTRFNNKSAMDHLFNADKKGINVFLLLLDIDNEWTPERVPPFVNGLWLMNRSTSLLNTVHDMLEDVCETSEHFCQFRKYNVSCSPNPESSGCVEGHIYNITKNGTGCPNVTNVFTPCTCPTTSTSTTTSTSSPSTTQPLTMEAGIIIGAIGGILLLISIVTTVILIRRRSKQSKTPVVPPLSHVAPNKWDTDRKNAVLSNVENLTKKELKSEKSSSNSSNRTSSLPSRGSDKKVASPGSTKKGAVLTKQSKLPKSPISSCGQSAKVVKK